MPSHQTALAQELKQNIRDEDLTKNATQCSINQQIFPLTPERFLSELPEPPLCEVFEVAAVARQAMQAQDRCGPRVFGPRVSLFIDSRVEPQSVVSGAKRFCVGC